MEGRILIVDDNEDVLLALNLLLKSKVEAVRVTTKPERIPEFMEQFNPDVILLDMNFTQDSVSGEEGYLWLERILAIKPSAVVLFITAYVDTAKAVRAIKAGATDFLTKPWNNVALLESVQTALKLARDRQSPVPTENSDSAGVAPIGSSPAMQRVLQQAQLVAQTNVSVLIMGENGTGKDVLAHYIHSISSRADKPFVSIDMGSLSESLFEDELFGHNKGAFTGAGQAKAGRVEEADGGTLFLDEVGNLSPAMQQKILTLIEKGEVCRLGSTKSQKVDVRLICATNAPLHARVQEGSFRQDLLYRINTIELLLPPLRERGEDVLLLADSFLKRFAKQYDKPQPQLDAKAQEQLLRNPWPGNVRQLLHAVERAVVLGNYNFEVQEPQPNAEASQQAASLNLEALEREAIGKAIAQANGNLNEAAELLGITRYALYRKLEKQKP